jgi:hypothetical protein
MNSIAREKFFSGSGPQRIWMSATLVRPEFIADSQYDRALDWCVSHMQATEPLKLKRLITLTAANTWLKPGVNESMLGAYLTRCLMKAYSRPT